MPNLETVRDILGPELTAAAVADGLMPAASPRVAGPGDNNPPPDLVVKADALLATADRWIVERKEITSEEIASRASDFLAQLRASESAIETERKAKKAPHMSAAEAVDAVYAPARDKVAAAKNAIKGMIERWLRKVEDDNRAKAQAAEREAQAAAKRAEEFARQAEQSAAPSVQLAAAAAAETAEAAQVTATKILAARPQVRGNLASRAVGFRTKKVAKIVDFNKALKHYATNGEVVALIQRLASADAGRGVCAKGCEIIEQRSVA